MEILDIKWKSEYPACALSNFYAHSFTFDGVSCASMEGFLQSLKYRNKKKQEKVCKLTDITAKKAGAKKFWWKLSGNLYWRGKRYKRSSKEYDTLLFNAYLALSKNAEFIKALESAKGKVLSHSCGKQDKRKTVLTVDEFLGYLNYIMILKGIV